MCGICGKVSPNGSAPSEMQQMLSAIAHRGPDDQGVFSRGPVSLGNRRLSIIDLSSGKQPISNEDQTVWVVFNGEIYNYRELRSALETEGHVFRTNSDTEVIVHLYENYGEDFVQYLSGMFAIALWDEKLGKLVLVRDRLGQKPLFYELDGETLYFASEVKSILAIRNRRRELDYLSLHYYLSLRFIPDSRTIFRDIQKLPAAHRLVYQDGNLSVSKYWELDFRDKLDLSEEAFTEGLRGQLLRAIESHLVSDVPIGAFLSGGLDSSIIVGMLARDLGVSLKTFAVGVEESDFNELPFAKMVAEHCRTDHHEAMVISNLVRMLPKMIWHLDEPSDPIAACMYHSAELASGHVKVVLGGDGGDELFAGFDRYMGNRYIDAYRKVPAIFRDQLIGPVLSRLPDSFTYKSLTQKLRWVHQLSGFSSPAAQYAEATSFFRFAEQDKQKLYANALFDELGAVDAAHVIIAPFQNAHADNLLDQMLYADFMTRLPEHSLMLTDRMTMAHGLEARSPFLDHELVQYMARFPAHMKLQGRTTKYILRKLARDYLPDAIVHREKQGFMFPIAYWFRNELFDLLKQLLLDSYFVRTGRFRKQAIENMLSEHRRGRRDHHVRLWMLLNLEIWHRMYIEGEEIESLSRVLAGTETARP